MMPGTSYEIDNKNPEDRKLRIKGLFDSIVPTYDLLNHLLSFGTDIFWRRRIFKLLHPVDGRIALDICCGTGDLSLLLSKHGADTVSLDFSIGMLKRGIIRQAITGKAVAADASRIPFRDNVFAAETIAFGIRNIPDLNNFIREAYRVLAYGGELAILELVRPRNRFIKIIYSLYLNKIMPIIGGLISGEKDAYKYLSGTIETFVDPLELKKLLEEYGFKNVSVCFLTFGVSAIIIAKK